MAVAIAFWRTPARPARATAPPPGSTPGQRLQHGLAFSVGPLVDHTLPWVALGLVAAGLGVAALHSGTLDALPAALQVPLTAVVGIPLFVCATGATPAAAALAEHGLSSGAALSLLVAGPALNLPALAVVRGLFGRRAAWILTAVVVGVASTAGWLAVALHLHVPIVEPTASPPGVLEWGAVVVLAGLAARSVVRQGARGVVAQIVEPVES